MSWFSSMFTGSNPTLDTNIKKFGQIGDFATNMGESSLTAGTDFEKALVSGDATKQMQVLAPAISAGKKSVQEENKTQAEFGTRSGGTAGATSARDDSLHAAIVDMIGNLTGNAASTLLSSGKGLLDTGVSTLETQDQAAQQQMANWDNSLFGMSLSKGVGFGEGFALGKV